MGAESMGSDRPSLPPPAHVLIVEDDHAMRHLVARFLTEAGFRVTGVRNGEEMWDAMERLPIDLVMLDIMLPGTPGLDLCRALRTRSEVPVIMVTARGDEAYRVLGLEPGADDYIPKPFGGPELVARARAVQRRSRAATHQPMGKRGSAIRFAGWTLNLARRELFAPEDIDVELSGAEYDLLLAFLEHPQRVLNRSQLLELSRSRLGDTADRSVDVLVSRLRRKIARDDADQKFIKTVRGAGYMFVPVVSRS
jgi:two-component system OmpR family response regulator